MIEIDKIIIINSENFLLLLLLFYLNIYYKYINNKFIFLLLFIYS
jgi:hypothetical protein